MATVQANNRLQPVAVASWSERGGDAALDAGGGVPPEVAVLRARLLGALAGRAAALAEADRCAAEDEARSADLEARGQLDRAAERIAVAVLRALEAVDSYEARKRWEEREAWRSFYAALPATGAAPDPRTAHPRAPPWTSYERSHAARVDAWETEDARAYVLARVERIRERKVAA